MSLFDFGRYLDDSLLTPKGNFLSTKIASPLTLLGSEQYSRTVEDQRSNELMARSRKLGEERRLYWNMLATHLPPVTAYVPPVGRRTEIVNLACGEAHEALTLSMFFGGNNFGNPSDNVGITGVDIDRRSIATAQELYQFDNKAGEPPRYRFLSGDAASNEIVAEYPDEVDVIVLRHPQIMTKPEMWGNMLKLAYSRLREGGLVIITTYLDEEQKIALDQANRLGGKVIVNKANPYATPVSDAVPSARFDKHVIVVEKTKPQVDLHRKDLITIFTLNK